MSGHEAFLRGLEGEAMAWLRRLVEVNSFTRHRPGVVRNAELVEEMFRPLGFGARRVRSVLEECGDHLFLTRRGGRGTLLLVSHLDTVYPHDFPWRDEGGRIHGPGVCDIKGGTVLMWMVLRALAANDPGLLDRFTLKLLFNATEEGGCPDFPRLARAEVDARAVACLVYEPGFEAGAATTLAVRRKGSGRFRLEVTGREAHSGHAHGKGASAIRELARRVEEIESWTDHARGLTFNVGLIEGGTAVNAVPGRAACAVDLRAWTREEYDAGRGRVMRLAGAGSIPGTRLLVRERPGYPPWPPEEKSARLGALAKECGETLGLALETPPRAGGSDGCHLHDLVPTLDGLGPVGRDPHCSVHDPATGREQESVDQTSFVPRALLSLALVERLAQA